MKYALLVGAGHVHMEMVARHSHKLREHDIALRLVAPGRFWSGAMIASFLAGETSTQSLSQPLTQWAARFGVEALGARAVGLDVRHRRLWLATGDVLRYDAISLNVGRESAGQDLKSEKSGHEPQLWSAISVSELHRLRSALQDAFRLGRKPRVLIAGETERAVAVAAGLALLNGPRELQLTLCVPGARVLPDRPPGAARRITRELAYRGVDIVLNTVIEGLSARAAVAADNRHFPTDHVVMADAGRPASLVRTAGLPVGEYGLQVTGRLYSPSDRSVFAAGGCMELLSRRPARVDDIKRQADVLAHNILAGFTPRPYRAYRRTRRPFSVDLAGDRRIGYAGPFWWSRRSGNSGHQPGWL